MNVYDASATRAALAFEALVPALQNLFAQGCETAPRQILSLGADGLASLIMAAWLPGLCYGVKTVNVAAGNAARGLPGIHASYSLFDGTTGAPLALIDGGELTARRTAAVSALAGSYLARPGAQHLLVVGAGRIGALLPAAWRVVRDIRRVSVWSRQAEHAQALAQQLRQQGFEAAWAPDLQAAAEPADIISCATLSSSPLIHGAWLRPGSHLDLIGSYAPHMREADDDCLRGAQWAFDHEEALTKSGDLIGPLAHLSQLTPDTTAK